MELNSFLCVVFFLSENANQLNWKSFWNWCVYPKGRLIYRAHIKDERKPIKKPLRKKQQQKCDKICDRAAQNICDFQRRLQEVFFSNICIKHNIYI